MLYPFLQHYINRYPSDPTVKGFGRELRLIRVDRWDSGLYYCSTNTSLRAHHNVTLRVDAAPRVTVDNLQGNAAKQAIGHEAKISCKVRHKDLVQFLFN